MWRKLPAMSLLLCLLSLITSEAVSLIDAIGSDEIKAISDALARSDGQNDLNKIGRGGQTPLMHSVLTGKINAVQLLLQAGADVTIGEENGYTPMHGAGFQGRAEIADILVRHGVSVHDVHEDGFTPFHRACWGIELRHADTVETFLNHGVDWNLLAKNGKSCLDMTTNKSTKKIIQEWMSQQKEKDSPSPPKKKKNKKKKTTRKSKEKAKNNDL